MYRKAYVLALFAAVTFGCAKPRRRARKPRRPVSKAPVAEATEPTAKKPPAEAPKPPPAPVTPPPPPEEHTVKLAVVADSNLATHSQETTDAYGGASSIKIKHRENFPILRFDTSAIPRNASVKKAGILLHVNDPDPNFFLSHVSASTVPTEWVEGTGRASGEHDQSCLLWPGPRDRKWGWRDDRDVLGSVFGNGGNVTCLSVAVERGEQWWEIPIDGRLVDAMRRDQPGGIILHDEMIYRVGKHANIFMDSREQAGGRFAPHMEATYTVEDAVAPSAPEVAGAEPGPYPGTVLLKIRYGGDDGDAGRALGFDIVAITANGARRKVERYMIPRPGAAGSVVPALFEGLDPGAGYSFELTAYDEAGNASPPARSAAVRACEAEAKALAGFKPMQVAKGSPLNAQCCSVYAVDGLTKVCPVTGEVLGPKGYEKSDARNGNHVYDGRERRVELFGAKGEILGFNLVLVAPAGVAGELPIEVSVKPGALTSPGGGTIPAGAFRLYRVFYAERKGRWYGEVAAPDPGPFRVLPSPEPKIEGQHNQMVAVDLYVPTDAAPGDYRGEISISFRNAGASLPVRLKVYPVTIPDELSFLVELNAYGQGNKDYFYAVHKLAHLHRLGYNVLTYSHSGNTTMPIVPRVQGEGHDAHVVDWSPWDGWMAPLLDGSAFADMPRAGVPIPHFYLPFYENWPMPLWKHYTDKALAERPRKDDAAMDDWKMRFARNAPLMEDALDAAWVEGNMAVARQFREHFEERGWTRTEFQVFLNNKYYKGNLSYWTLDEPSAGHGFRALAYVYETFMEPFEGSKLRVIARGDVSRPGHQGDRMDGVPNLMLNMSGGYHRHAPLVRRFLVRRGFTTWLYGGGPDLDADNAAVDALIVKSWCMGTVGCMPYWTSFSGSNEWTKGGPIRQVFGGQRHGYKETVVGCLRMAAMRRGQLDCEILNLLAARPGWDRWQVSRTVARHLDLTGEVKARGADDPGRMSFKGVDASRLAALRRAVLEELSR